MIHLKESERKYKKECQKHIAVNLTLSDYERWRAYAEIRGLRMASMIRSLVNAAIDETENDYSMSISDIIEMQEKIKEDANVLSK